MSFSRLQTSQSRLRIHWQNAPNLDRRDLVTFEQVFGHIAKRAHNRPILLLRKTDKREDRVKTLLSIDTEDAAKVALQLLPAFAESQAKREKAAHDVNNFPP